MEKTDRNKIGQSFVFWVSHSLKCLSIHPASRFEAMNLPSHTAVWQMVHEFVQMGYIVQ